MEMERKIAVIDVDSIAYKIFHPKKVLDKNNIPLRSENKFVYKEKNEQEILYSCNFVMDEILTNCNCTHYIGYIKGFNTTSFRKSINNSYKSNRSLDEPKWWSYTKDMLIH